MLAAMLEIERRSMIEATQKMMELNGAAEHERESSNRGPRLLDEMMVIIAAYIDQIVYLRDRYEAGQ